MFFLIFPLIVFVIWYAYNLRNFFSDDASAIESFQSIESLNRDGQEKQEDFAKKSKQENLFLIGRRF